VTELPILYTLGHQKFLPTLEAAGEDFRYVIYYNAIANLARDMGLEVASVQDAIDMEVTDKAQTTSLWLEQKILDDLSYGNLVSLAPDLPKLHSPDIQQWLPGLTFELLQHILSHAMGIERIIDEHGIEGVLLHEDVTIDGRLLAALGENYGVPVLHMPHANHFLQPDSADIHTESRSDKLGVFGKYMKDWYIAAGVQAKNITIVGNPAWDAFYEEKENIKQPHARRCFGFEEDKPVWLYATSWAQSTGAWGRGQEDLFDSFRWVVDTVKNADVQFFVKLHPNEGEVNVQRYTAILKEAGISGVISAHYNGHALMASDVVITQGSSNLAVEAGIMGKPVVEMWQVGTKYPAVYNIPGTWGPDLRYIINEAIAEGPNKKFIEDMNTGPGSSERARDWIVGEILDANNKI
jgi:hypothetical protein